MTVRVCYMAQLRQAAGVPTEQIDLPAPCSLVKLLDMLASKHGESLRRLLQQGTTLVIVNDEQVASPDRVFLKDGDSITFLTPIAGG
jgi:molybdopterin converting factor small subunit